MKRFAFALVLISALAVSFQAPSAKPTFAKNVQPLLKKYCIGCHTGPASPDKVDFSVIKNDADAKKHLKILKKGLEEIREKEMPPGATPKPTMAETKLFADYLKTVK